MSRLLKIALVAFALCLSALTWAETKVAVVDVQGAILNTDFAQQRISEVRDQGDYCLLYTSPSPRDRTRSRMPSSA